MKGLSPEWQQWRRRQKPGCSQPPALSSMLSGEASVLPCSPVSASRDPQCPYSGARIISVIIQQVLGQQVQALCQDRAASFLLCPLSSPHPLDVLGDTWAVNGPILLGGPFAPAGEGQRWRAQYRASDPAGWSSSSASYQLSDWVISHSCNSVPRFSPGRNGYNTPPSPCRALRGQDERPQQVLSLAQALMVIPVPPKGPVPGWTAAGRKSLPGSRLWSATCGRRTPLGDLI